MADIRAAILTASLAADRLHKQFDTKDRADAGEGRIDVFDMLVQNEIPVVFKPLKGLLGAFLNEDGSAGVMVTTQRNLAVQRFTAAHELGHVTLGHEPSLDPEGILFRSPIVDREERGYDLQEIQANVFASQLLVPRWLIVKHLKRQEWTRSDMARSDVVYQLSLRLGVSYSATCHALLRLKVIDEVVSEQLLSVPRRTIKKRLAAPHEPASWHGDVWVVTERDDGILLEGSRTDMVVVKVKEHSGSGYLWQLEDLAEAGLAVVRDDRAADPDKELVGGVVFRTVIAESTDGAEGHVCLQETRPWQAKGEPLQSLKMDVDFYGPVDAGLYRAQRSAFLGVA
jgi:Zn-dependent peptidase ImmA (M78 family)/predicted secreted protein